MSKASDRDFDFIVASGLLKEIGGPAEAVIPDGTTKIANFAYFRKYNLKNITIPDSVTAIGDYAFQECRALREITIPSGVTEIGAGAFQDCPLLATVTIPSSIKKIGRDAFKGCASLTNIEIPTGVDYIAPGVFSDCESLERVVLPETITEISEDAFRGCWCLKDINIPDSVTCIGYRAFWNCEALMRNSAKDDCGAKYFGNKANPYLVLVGESNKCDVSFCPSTKIIYDEAFKCSFCKEITIPEHIVQIGHRAFAEADELTVTFAGAIPKIGKKAFEGGKGIVTSNLKDLPAECKPLAVQGFLAKYAAGEADEAYITIYTDYIKRQRKNLLSTLEDPTLLRNFLAEKNLLPV